MSKFKTLLKAGAASVATAGALVAHNAHAALVDADVVSTISDASGDLELVGKAIIGVVAIVVVFSLVMSIIRKA